MSQKFNDLDELIINDSEAHEYFSSLPSYVKQQVMTRSSSINSFESLKTYADNLLRGDD